MTELFKYIMERKEIFSRFKQFLWLKVGQNQQKFRNFSNYPDVFKHPFLIEFLEKEEGVPIVDAINFYAIRYPGKPSSFSVLITYTICCEFDRIENNKVTNYIPF